ncbi:MAG: hypothetical protein ACMUEM_05745 [Flavobacteriales bacterium AspAUS03]
MATEEGMVKVEAQLVNLKKEFKKAITNIISNIGCCLQSMKILNSSFSNAPKAF